MSKGSRRKEPAMKTIKNIPVGSIFAESYGCNANQTAFYQVVHSTTHFVDVRRIGATVGEQLEGMDYTLVPEKDKFIEEQSRRFKVKNWTSNPRNPMPCIMTGYMPAFLI